MGMSGQRHAPAALPPGKIRYPLYRKLGGPQGQSEQVRNTCMYEWTTTNDERGHGLCTREYGKRILRIN
jgi:hypothetical protein